MCIAKQPFLLLSEGTDLWPIFDATFTLGDFVLWACIHMTFSAVMMYMCNNMVREELVQTRQVVDMTGTIWFRSK